MASILADVTSIVTSAQTWITSFVGTITSTPLLLMFTIVGFVGLAVGLIRRLIRL